MTGHQFTLPPQLKTQQGQYRRVGFELEFSGIDLEEVCGLIQTIFQARLCTQTAVEHRLESSLGTFVVELDWSFIKRHAAQADDNPSFLMEEWWRHLGQAAALFVPIEVVCPPIDIRNIDSLQVLVDRLRETGAQGTNESIIAAYGVHINTEIPALDAKNLFAWLRAFALLQWWLVEQHQLDLTRRISPYVNLYPDDYLICLFSCQQPDMETIFSDYLQFNADRNRALDLLPILAQIDNERIQREVNDERIKARPAFHYRLPNCQIDREHWSLAKAWNLWCVVERLADRPDDLTRLAAKFLESDRPFLGVNRAAWVEFIDQWLKDQELL